MTIKKRMITMHVCDMCKGEQRKHLLYKCDICKKQLCFYCKKQLHINNCYDISYCKECLNSKTEMMIRKKYKKYAIKYRNLKERLLNELIKEILNK